jgi:Protein of unknown function (DUF2393)
VSANSPFGESTEASGPRDRNWVPLVVALVLVLGMVVAGFMLNGRPKPPAATPINASLDPYAASLVVSNVAMSEASNMAGTKVTYIDGHVANNGTKTLTSVRVQVLFRNGAQEVAQNETMPLLVIRSRDPYIDTATQAQMPLKPGAQEDFRLAFDSIVPDWAGAVPDIRIVQVEPK